MILALAFAMVKQGQCIRVPFVPLPPQDEPDAPRSWIRAVPDRWGIADGVQYMHCTDLYRLPSIMKYGLRCGPRGYGAGCPENHRYLYTFKSRKAALDCYATASCLRIQLPDQRDVFSDKYFQVWIGVGTAGEWERPKKIARKKRGKNQFAFRPGTYTPLWVEYVPVDGPLELIPDFVPSVLSTHAGREVRHIKRWRQKEKRAMTLIYDIDNDLVPQPKSEKPIEATPNWWKESQEKQKPKRTWDSIDWDSNWKYQESNWKEKDPWTDWKDENSGWQQSSKASSSKDKDWRAAEWKSDSPRAKDWKASWSASASSSQGWQGDRVRSPSPPWRKSKPAVEPWPECRDDRRVKPWPECTDDRPSDSGSSWKRNRNK